MLFQSRGRQAQSTLEYRRESTESRLTLIRRSKISSCCVEYDDRTCCGKSLCIDDAKVYLLIKDVSRRSQGERKFHIVAQRSVFVEHFRIHRLARASFSAHFSHALVDGIRRAFEEPCATFVVKAKPSCRKTLRAIAARWSS